MGDDTKLTYSALDSLQIDGVEQLNNVLLIGELRFLAVVYSKFRNIAVIPHSHQRLNMF